MTLNLLKNNKCHYKKLECIALKTNHRDPIVEEILQTLNDN
jgi:hypothetical protein